MTKIKKLQEQKEWDKYWTKKKTKSQDIYRIIASFYRRCIIKRTLNHFIEKEFKNGSKLLHAGAGTGQVDTDILKSYDITALDISPEALKLYKFYNGNKAKVIVASIFDIPSRSLSYDGVYNLGVHEHFTMEENEKILKEFARVLKPNGKIVLFWPPKFGVSVIFLNSLHFLLNNILGKKIQLHPEEISLIKSKRQVSDLLKKAGFKPLGLYFGPIDLFTQFVVVGRKINRKNQM